MPIETIFALSAAWYEGRLDPEVEPMTAEDRQNLLTEVGLTGEFWQLR